MSDPQATLVSSLLEKNRYPHAARAVRLIETHISWILLAGRYAYKIKKAVHLDFLDFSSLEARHFYCEEEIRLNGRLAGEIYLDVIPIGGSPESPIIGGLPAIEYAVRMKRFPMKNAFDRLAEKGLLKPVHLDLLAEKMAAFHASLLPAEVDSGYGMGMQDVMRKTFGGLKKYVRKDLSSLEKGMGDECVSLEAFFSRRLKEGYVRECHGDLHLGNIVLFKEKPVPFDCIEFDPKLRWIDLMNEIAFTVMDLLHHGLDGLAFRFLNAYLERTGDYGGVKALRFHLANRAVVRAMVEAIRSESDTPSCSRHLALACNCLKGRKPFLVITHGLPGSGKTTFSQTALERLKAIRIRSDVERKRMAGLSQYDRSHSGLFSGIYSPGFSKTVYSRLLDLARELLESGYPVIVDAAFLDGPARSRFMDLANSLSIPFAIASMSASNPESRIMRRLGAGNDASDADLAVLEAKKASADPLSREEQVQTALFPDQGGEAWERLEQCLGLC